MGLPGLMSSQLVGGHLTDAQIEELKMAFDMIDTDKSGTLDASELKGMLMGLTKREVSDREM